MLLTKASNTHCLNFKKNYVPHLDQPIPLKSKINFTKVSARKKIYKKRTMKTIQNIP